MAKSHTVNIHEAKTHLSRLLERVSHGEDVIIAKAGKPIARLSAVAARGKRVLGLDAGRVVIAPDFDAPLPDDVLTDFER
jgi:prevent-host-death family protein